MCYESIHLFTFCSVFNKYKVDDKLERDPLEHFVRGYSDPPKL